jgi:hypothetical protein
MDPTRELEFIGAGNYWNLVQGRRRTAHSRGVYAESSQGSESQPELERVSALNDVSTNMGPIKENGMTIWYGGRDRIMLICTPGTKRKATEEPNTPSDSKRIKSSNSEEPETNNVPRAPNVIPFPEKVSWPNCV